MRISMDPADPGFKYAGIASECQVYLDGRGLQCCLTADEEMGVVTVYQIDERSRLIPDGRGFALLVQHQGDVKIVVSEKGLRLKGQIDGNYPVVG